MKIPVVIEREYNLSIDELSTFKDKCLEYVKEHFEECAIKDWDDIPNDVIEDMLTDKVANLLEDAFESCAHEGILLDDYSRSIKFDFDTDGVYYFIEDCVHQMLTDIDYKPKFKQLLELSENLQTGYFDKEQTKYNHNGFRLFSQAASVDVHFTPMTLCWTVSAKCEGNRTTHCGIGWNELIQYLCIDSNLTWFSFMSDEDIQKCKLWKKRAVK